jgi:DNA-binding MarR family transcriptional regulator
MAQKPDAKDEAGESILEIFDRLPRVFFKLKAFGDRVWSPLGLTTSERGLMTDLARGERLTSPQLAAMRPVSRQAVQPVLTSLAERGLIRTASNPRNARSPLYAITKKGLALLERGRKREAEIVSVLGTRFRAPETRRVAKFLRDVDALLAEQLETND